MDAIQFITELDKRIDYVQNVWAEQVAYVYNSDKKPEKKEKLIKRINKDYSDILSDLLISREEAFNRQATKEYNDALKKAIEENQKIITKNRPIEPEKKMLIKTDENGRPIGMKFVNGEWVPTKNAHARNKTSE